MFSNGLACDVLRMHEAITWLGFRIFVDMESQLSLEYNVSHCLIGDDM